MRFLDYSCASVTNNSAARQKSSAAQALDIVRKVTFVIGASHVGFR